jgi:DNA-binding CsgD family transcriptional regulator
MARSREFQNPDKLTGEETKTLEEFEDRLDLIRSRVGLLTGTDKTLMQIYLDNSGTFRQMSRIAGINEANVARRIHKLIRRLLDGQYITCLRNRKSLTDEQVEIARDYFVYGLPMSEIARRHEISYYAVRKAMKKIQILTRVTRKAETSNIQQKT